MVKIIRSTVDEYKIAYENIKQRCEIAELFNKSYEKKIKKLEEENNAYKVLLKKQIVEEDK